MANMNPVYDQLRADVSKCASQSFTDDGALVKEIFCSMYPPEVIAAHELLLTGRYAGRLSSYETLWVVCGDEHHTLSFAAPGPAHGFPDLAIPSPGRVDATRFPELHAWMKRMHEMHTLVSEVSRIVYDLQSMANTPGQLVRMVPDLARFITGYARQQLNQQERRSPIPYAWAAYPKENVDRLLNTLAMASLLPARNQYDTCLISLGPRKLP